MYVQTFFLKKYGSKIPYLPTVWTYVQTSVFFSRDPSLRLITLRSWLVWEEAYIFITLDLLSLFFLRLNRFILICWYLLRNILEFVKRKKGSQKLNMFAIFHYIKDKIGIFWLNKGENSHFYPMFYTFLAYLRHLRILSRITRQSPPIGPLSPPMCPPPMGGDKSPPMPKSVGPTLQAVALS